MMRPWTGHMHDELRGWKAIAAHLGTSDRTAQRWERDLGLPVHRAGNSRGSTVVATRGELDDWRLSPAGRRAEVEGPADPSAVPAPPGVVRRPAWRRPMVGFVGAACVLLVSGAMWLASRPASRSEAPAPGRPGPPAGVPGSLQPGAAPVVVLKLTADTGEVWTVRLVEGAAATWEVVGGRRLTLAVALEGARARLTASETRGSDAGADRAAPVGTVLLAEGVPAPMAHAGRQVSVEWTGTETGPPARIAPASVVPPRCCLSCGGITVCATEVGGWCGSCCDPRFTSCRPAI
jgi:hypothetical protein